MTMCSSLQIESCIAKKSRKERQTRTLSMVESVAVELVTQLLELVDFTTTTWKY